MKKAEEHFNKTISWYQKRGVLPYDWFEVGQPAFKRALKIAQQEKADEIWEWFREISVNLMRDKNSVLTAHFDTIMRALQNNQKEVDTEEEAYDITHGLLVEFKDEIKNELKKHCGGKG